MTNSLLILKSPNKGDKWAAASPLATHTLQGTRSRVPFFVLRSLLGKWAPAHNSFLYSILKHKTHHEENHDTFDARIFCGCDGAEHEERAHHR